MRAILAFVALIIGLALTAPSYAFLHHGAPSVGAACSRGLSDPTDGCAGANQAALFRQPTAFLPGGYFNTTSGTTTNYMATNCGLSGTSLCRPSWNVAGVDYPVGNYTSPASMNDPATMSLPGCTYSTSSSGGGLLTCGGSSFHGVLQHVDFGPHGTHGCTALNLPASAPAAGVTTLLIDDIYFFNDAGNCSVAANVTIWGNFSGTAANIYPGGITISNLMWDDNFSVWDDQFGACAQPTSCNAASAFAGVGLLGPTVIKYSAFVNVAGAIMATAANPVQGGATLQWDWVGGWVDRAAFGHSEYVTGAFGSLTGLGLQKIDHVTISRPLSSTQFGPAPYFWAANYPMAIGEFDYTSNVQINAATAGLTADGVMSGCMGAPPVGGTATSPTCDTTPGPIFYLTAGTVGQGVIFPVSGTCAGGGVGALYKFIPGAYPIHTTGPDILGEWELDGLNSGAASAYYPNFTPAGLACSNVTTTPRAATAGVMTGHGPRPFGSGNISNNYFDFKSQTNGLLYNFVNTQAAAGTGTITTVGGVSNVVFSATITLALGEYINGVGIDGCSSGIHGCPTNTTAGTYTAGTPIPISPAVTAVGSPITMQWLAPTICTTPFVLSGNQDMSNTISSTILNQLTTGAAVDGC
jgi:hypothetical protein